jgi:hypothetical protein
MEELGTLVPGVTDALIGWGRAALSLVAGAARTGRPAR